jgi:hypothetical protein
MAGKTRGDPARRFQCCVRLIAFCASRNASGRWPAVDCDTERYLTATVDSACSQELGLITCRVQLERSQGPRDRTAPERGNACRTRAQALLQQALWRPSHVLRPPLRPPAYQLHQTGFLRRPNRSVAWLAHPGYHPICPNVGVVDCVLDARCSRRRIHGIKLCKVSADIRGFLGDARSQFCYAPIRSKIEIVIADGSLQRHFLQCAVGRLGFKLQKPGDFNFDDFRRTSRRACAGHCRRIGGGNRCILSSRNLRESRQADATEQGYK